MKMKIREFREWVGITQVELAVELSALYGDPDWVMHGCTISRLESGRCVASLDTFRLLVAWGELQCMARGLDPFAHEFHWHTLHKPESDFKRELVFGIARERVQGMNLTA